MIYIKALLAASAALSMSYLITSFIMWDLDASAWPHEARAVTAFIGVMGAYIASAVTVALAAQAEDDMEFKAAMKKHMESRK